MRLAAATTLALIACQSSDSSDRFPIVPGGGGMEVTPAPDGPRAGDGGDGSSTFAGRVCVVADPRNLTSCTTADASGISVALGASMAVTASDGSFSIAPPQSSLLVWTVTSPGFVPTVMPLGTVHLLPLISEARYNEMLLDNGVVVQAGQGSLFVRVVRNALPLAGVTATVEPPSLFGPLYDGANALVWDTDATGSSAVVWIPDALQGTATVTLSPPSSTPLVLSIPVTDGALTFATVGIP